MLNVVQIIFRICDRLMTTGLNVIAPTALKVTKAASILQNFLITVVAIVTRDNSIKLLHLLVITFQ